MRLIDLIALYEDVIKRHDGYDKFSNYDVISMLENNTHNYLDDLVVFIHYSNERVYIVNHNSLNGCIYNWLQDNFDTNDIEIIFKGDSVMEDLEFALALCDDDSVVEV